MPESCRHCGGPPWHSQSHETVCDACDGYYDERPRPNCTQASAHHFPTWPTTWSFPLKPGRS